MGLQVRERSREGLKVAGRQVEPARCRCAPCAGTKCLPKCAMRRCAPCAEVKRNVCRQAHSQTSAEPLRGGVGSLDAYRGPLEHEGPSRALCGTGAPASSAPSQGMSARRAANPTLSPASEIPLASVAASRWTLRWPGFPGPAFAQSSGVASCTGLMDADLEDRSTSASHCSALCSAPCETTRACRR